MAVEDAYMGRLSQTDPVDYHDVMNCPSRMDRESEARSADDKISEDQALVSDRNRSRTDSVMTAMHKDGGLVSQVHTMEMIFIDSLGHKFQIIDAPLRAPQ